MMGHKICFYGEILIIIPKLPPLPLLIWSTGTAHYSDLNEKLNKSLHNQHHKKSNTCVWFLLVTGMTKIRHSQKLILNNKTYNNKSLDKERLQLLLKHSFVFFISLQNYTSCLYTYLYREIKNLKKNYY